VRKHLKIQNNQCCGSGSAWIRIDVGRLDPDPEEKKIHKKIPGIEKSKEISCFEVLDVLSSELTASPVAWTSFTETEDK
jgi:hypothetical protein